MGWGSSSSPPRSLPIPHSSPPHHPAQRPALLSPSEDLLLLQVASDGISCQEERIAQRKPQTAAAPWGSARALTVLQEGPSARRPAELGQHGGVPGGLLHCCAELCGHCSSAFGSCGWEGPPGLQGGGRGGVGGGDGDGMGMGCGAAPQLWDGCAAFRDALGYPDPCVSATGSPAALQPRAAPVHAQN